MNDRIVREPERYHMTQRSPAQWWRDERDGLAPRRIRIGANSVGWRLSALTTWLDSREVVSAENTKPVAPGSKRGRKRKCDYPALTENSIITPSMDIDHCTVADDSVSAVTKEEF